YVFFLHPFRLSCSHPRCLFCFFSCSGHRLLLHSFPTRRSSDLLSEPELRLPLDLRRGASVELADMPTGDRPLPAPASGLVRRRADRKSTRLNSSHVSISYAVFCLKKKNNILKMLHLVVLLPAHD